MHTGSPSTAQVHSLAAGPGVQLRGQTEDHTHGGGAEWPHGTPQVQDQQEDPARSTLPARTSHALPQQKGELLILLYFAKLLLLLLIK